MEPMSSTECLGQSIRTRSRKDRYRQKAAANQTQCQQEGRAVAEEWFERLRGVSSGLNVSVAGFE